MTPVQEKIISSLTGKEWKTIRQISKEIKAHHSLISANVRSLCQDGYVVKKPDPDNGIITVYKAAVLPASGRVRLLDSYLRGCHG